MTGENKGIVVGMRAVDESESGKPWFPEWEAAFSEPGYVRFLDPTTGEHVRIEMNPEQAHALGCLMARMTDELRNAREQLANVWGELEVGIPKWQVSWGAEPFLKFQDGDGDESRTVRISLPARAEAPMLGMFLHRLTAAVEASRKQVRDLQENAGREQRGMLDLRRKYGAREDETATQWIARLGSELMAAQEARRHLLEERSHVAEYLGGNPTEPPIPLVKRAVEELQELRSRVKPPPPLMATDQQINLLEARLVKLEQQESPYRLAVHAEQGLPGESMAVAEVVVSLEFMPAESRLEIERSRPTRTCDVQSLAVHLMAKYQMGEKAFRPVTMAEMDRLKPDWREVPWQTGDQADPEKGARLNPVTPAADPTEKTAEKDQPTTVGEVLGSRALRAVLEGNPKLDRWTSVICPACDRVTLGASRSAVFPYHVVIKCTDCGFHVDTPAT